MALQISVFLLFVLFTAGHSLNCYSCEGSSCTTTATCATGLPNCLSYTYTVNSATVKAKACFSSACATGSLNFGTGKFASSCCSTDLCNSQDATDPTSTNGNKCYYCDGKNCSKTVDCSGTEDRCFNATVSSQVYKGCVSKSICGATGVFPTITNVTCCSGNLCNGAESVTQSFLFLCCSLLSFILLY